MREANYDEVICPNCVTQFRAIPINVQNELVDLRKELAAMHADYQSACRTVALMHRAACSGEIVSPKRGVVEDVEDLRKERDALRAELEKIKQQKPAGFAIPDSAWDGMVIRKNKLCSDAIPLYLAPGAQPVPEGYQIVPIEPSDEMIDAGCGAAPQYRVDCVRTYKAMLEAAKP